MRLLCNASNQLAILSRIAIMIKLILIVSIVARIGIPQFWIVQLMTCSLGCDSQNWSIADGTYEPEWMTQRLEDCPRIHGNAQESRNPFAILKIVKDCVRFGNWLKIQLHCVRIAKKWYNPQYRQNIRRNGCGLQLNSGMGLQSTQFYAMLSINLQSCTDLRSRCNSSWMCQDQRGISRLSLEFVEWSLIVLRTRELPQNLHGSGPWIANRLKSRCNCLDCQRVGGNALALRDPPAILGELWQTAAARNMQDGYGLRWIRELHLHCVKIAEILKSRSKRPITLQSSVDLQSFCNPLERRVETEP